MSRVIMHWALIACALALGLIEFLALQRARSHQRRAHRHFL